jgi:hypothetical protein
MKPLILWGWFFDSSLPDSDKDSLIETLQEAVLCWSTEMLSDLFAELDRHPERITALTMQAADTRLQLEQVALHLLTILAIERDHFVGTALVYVGTRDFIRDTATRFMTHYEQQLARPGSEGTMVTRAILPDS